jgi:hypothetical protein
MITARRFFYSLNAPDEGPKNFGVAFALFAKDMTKFFGHARWVC